MMKIGNQWNWSKMMSLAVAASLFGSMAHAESISKHPRVAELEDSLRAEASNYLRSRFPDQPFLVSVSANPLRRSTGKNSADSTGTELPYFDASDTEITDEWDDPNISLHQLLLRTTKVAVEISLSENVSDGERAEVRDSLYRSLHLIPARDEIKIETRKWSSVRSYTYYFVTGAAIILFFLIGFSIVQRYGYKRIAQALSNIQVQHAGGGAISASMPQGPTSNPETRAGNNSEFSGTFEAREFVAKLVGLAEKSPVFPTFHTMVGMNELGRRKPASLGALLQELPSPMQRKMFTYGADDCWFEAMLKPGPFGSEEVEHFQRWVREATYAQEPQVEEMLIRVWRLGDELDGFLRGLDREVALSLLSMFPKDLAIQHARKAFPGAWADLLDSGYRAVKFTEAQCRQISENAVKVKPLLDFSRLAQYRQLNELVKFLQTAGPEEEKEIYLISRPDSMIHRTRPPFYPVLEASEEELRTFVGQFTPQQWTLALFNIARNSRKKIQDGMQEKQRMLFIERLKQLDQNHPDPKQVGQMREAIARKFKEHLVELTTLQDTLKSMSQAENGAESDGDQAA